MLAGQAGGGTGPARRQAAWGIASIVALGAASFAWLRQTNFRGYDEWVILSLLPRGILSFPHAHRPLNMIWCVPAWLLAPDRLWGFLVVHAAWLTATGIFTFLIVRRLLPGAGVLAFLSGAFAVVWMPSENTRLATVQMAHYSGCTAGTLLASWLLVEAWCRRRPVILIPAAMAATAAVLSLEAALPILGLAPFLLLFAGGRAELRRWIRWVSGTVALLAALIGWILLPLVTNPDALTYQAQVLAVVPSAWNVLRRIGFQFRYELLPLVASPRPELAAAAVPTVVIVFVAGFVLATRSRFERDSRSDASRSAVARAGLIGLIYAGLGFLPFMLMRSVRGIGRTEFFATPGVAVLLAAGVVLAASFAGRRYSTPVACLLGVWVAAVGTGRTMAMQREWDASVYGNQRRILRELTTIAPRVEPQTLIVLLQNAGAWHFDFTFARAVDYLYEGAARGTVPGADSLFYETRFEADGVVSERAPVLRGPWHEETLRYRYDQVVVLVEQPNGRLFLLDTWPDAMAPLPAGAAYAPRTRIRTELAPSKRVSLLDTEP